MSTFHYTATDARGQTLRGEIVADDESAARREVTARGLTLVDLSLSAETKAPARLSAREAEQVVVALAEVSRSELPLAAGLRAAARECTSRRVASALRQIASQIEQGYALESILSEQGRYLPPHVRGLVVAAARSRRLGVALDELVEHHRAIREAWSEVLSALAYPAIVLGTAFMVILGLMLFIVPTFARMFEEFELRLPGPTQALVGLSSVANGLATGPGLILVGCALLGIVIFCVAASLGWGTVWTQRLAIHMPLVGKMWWWSNSAAWTRLLATLLDQNLALPQALELVSDGVRDPLSRQTVRWLAQGVEQGHSLSDLLAQGVHLPASMLPFVRWGETTGQLPAALRNVSEMLLARLHSRAKVLYSVAPSLVFLLVGFAVGFTVIALFMPLVSLIQGLTYNLMENIFGSLSLCVLIWIGIAVLWAERVAYHGASAKSDDPIRLMLKVGGWVLIVLGILGAEFQLMIFLAPFAWAVTAAVLIVAFVRYRTGERRALIACLAAAAERQIPLEQAARAFAKERTDDMGMCAARLARLLESGVPLANALSQTWMFLPYDVLLAVRLGDETGDVSGAVKKVARMDHEAESLLRSILEKLFYLVVLTNVLVGILTFVMLKIVPVFAKMFDEFGLELPPPTQVLIRVSDWIANYWFLAAPLILPANAILLIGGLYYVYLLPRDIPLLNRVSLRWDWALIMRSLSLAVRQQRPFLNMIRILSDRYPRGSVRRRLRQALMHMNNAESWTDALWRTGLLRTVDAAVLSAAQRSGNLEWALDEMAESGARRITYRLRLLLNLAYPTLSFSYGLAIAFVVVSLFMPLVALIQGLT